MTTRTLLFDSPFLLGFDRTRDLIDRAARAAADSYPPYNVEQYEDGRVRIVVAVAGFAPEELTVTVEGRQLAVSGKREAAEAAADDTPQTAYLHRGIAARGFIRNFVLADGLEVQGAALEHGLLRIDMARPDDRPVARRIPIQSL